MLKTNVLITVVALFALTGSAVAQSSTGKTVNVPSGKPVRLGVFPALGKDCAAGPVPEVKITRPPAHGVFHIRRVTGKTGGGRCPAGTEVVAQVVIYQSNPGYVGTDLVAYEVSADGNMRSYTVGLSVSQRRPDGKKGSTFTDI